MAYHPQDDEPLSFRNASANILEALTNLIYLARIECDDREKVILYMDLSNERVEALIELLKTRVWDRT